MRLAMLLLSCAWLSGQSGLNRPFAGQMIDLQGFLRPVYGLSGNFNVEGPVAERVLASACSLTLCLAKTESALVSAGDVTPAPPGDARIALDSTGATVYFAQTRQFERWQNGSLTMLNLSVEGSVLSLASTASGLAIAVERSGIVWIVSPDGSILDTLPPGAGAVLVLPTVIVYTETGSLVLRKSDHSELRFAAPGIDPNTSSLTALGDGYVEAGSASLLYALRIVAGRERLFQLPQPRYREPGR